jgi:PAS domain S-box-containing protein
MGVGLAVLCGWALGIEGLKGVLPGFVTMKANTALCFTLAGAALAFRGRPPLRLACAAAILVLAGLTLTQEFTGADFGIDQILVRDSLTAPQTVAPGRMSPATALGFILSAAALLLLGAGTPVRPAAEALALSAGATGAIAILGYAYGVEELYHLPGFTSMALHTAAAFVTLATGILCARPDGIAGVFASPGGGGRLARRLLPLALLIPASFGWLAELGQRAELFAPAQGTAVFASMMTIAMVALIWRAALSLETSEAARARAGKALGESRARLAGIVHSAMDAVITVDEGQRIVLFNAAAERMFGCSQAEAIGSEIDRFIPARFREAHARHIAGFGRTGETSRAVGHLGALSGLRADGEEFPVEASISQVEVAGHKLFTVILRDISERLRAERALLESRQDLNRAQAVAHVGSWRLDLRRNELAWSAENHRIFGVPEGTPMTYEGFLGIIHPEDREYVHREWSAGLRGAPYDIEHRIVVGDTVKWVRERAELEFDEKGGLLGGFGTTQDITERKAAELALRQKTEELELAIAGSGGALWEIAVDPARPDRLPETMKISPQLKGFLGFRDDELPNSGAAWFERIHPEDAPAVRASALAQINGTAPAHQVEYRIRHKDGSWRWIASSGRLFCDEQGRPLRWAGVEWDITERKQAEATLRESEERLRLFIEHAPAALAMFDREMRYIHASRRWLSDYGLGERDLRGLSHYEIFPGIPERWKAVHRRGLSGEVVRAEEDRIERADGSVQWLRWEVRPWYDALGAAAGILIFTEDITAAKGAEDLVRSIALFPEENPGPVLRAAGDGTLLYANAAAMALLEGWHCSVGGRLPEPVCLALGRALEAGERRELETPWGERLLSFVLVPFAERGYANLYGRDVTERKRAEEALLESEQRLRLAQQVARIGTFEWNIQTGVNRWTPELETMYGLAPGRFPGTQEAWEKLVYFEDRAEAVRRVSQAMEKGGFEGEWRVVWPDDSVHWLAGRAWVFKDQDGKPLRLIGINIDITERKAAEAALRQYADRLQALSRRLIEIQETERRAISRELHDEIGQVLTAVKIRLQSAERRQHRGGAAPDLKDSVEMVEDAIQRVRNRSLDLRPTLLDDLGLVPTIRWYLDRHAGQAGFTAEIVAEPLVPRPPPEVETSCFRVVQEAVTNAMRHARAKHLRIGMKQRAGRLEFSIRDDGVGFDVEAAPRPGRGKHRPPGDGGAGSVAGRRIRDRLVPRTGHPGPRCVAGSR